MSTNSKQYVSMSVTAIGSVADLTLGNNGSSLDGTGTLTQRGGGNDGRGPNLGNSGKG